jgi:hypothetical protein
MGTERGESRQAHHRVANPIRGAHEDLHSPRVKYRGAWGGGVARNGVTSRRYTNGLGTKGPALGQCWLKSQIAQNTWHWCADRVCQQGRQPASGL